ncbi:methionine ABC transporter ATP-binding protein [Marinitoga sp. 1137]|uniref:methionine ABC transporter ATP-binding protein n=1 Tax=unclassified Marinitoga TaxID=2640159 RepID=UPI001E565DFD|nr:methionine ABC transporter ATP-binding protein [Marinitoga sp. 1137]
MNVLLEVKNLNLTYDGLNYILKDINFNIKKGEIVGIIGLSGAGKSSLLRALTLLKRPEGKILFNNIDLTSLSGRDLRKIRKKIGVAFQHYNLLSRKNVFDNIALPLILNKERNIEKRVIDIIKKVGLDHRIKAFPSQLSGGEKQRVSIARAIVSNPDILFLDEPTSALDPKTTEKILELILKINIEMAISTIIITHEMDVIKRICDKILYLKNGRVYYYGEVYKFFSEFENELNNEFYKDVNFNYNKLKERTGKIIKIIFYGNNVEKPILYNIAKKYNITFNILYGKIEEFKNAPFGKLIIEIEGNGAKEFIYDLQKHVYSLEVL